MVQHSGRIAGVDLGDGTLSVCIIEASSGEVIERARVRTRASAIARYFARAEIGRMLVALETGTHSPWASRVTRECGHDVITANARKVRLVYACARKNDRVDADPS